MDVVVKIDAREEAQIDCIIQEVAEDAVYTDPTET